MLLLQHAFPILQNGYRFENRGSVLKIVVLLLFRSTATMNTEVEVHWNRQHATVLVNDCRFIHRHKTVFKPINKKAPIASQLVPWLLTAPVIFLQNKAYKQPQESLKAEDCFQNTLFQNKEERS